ncbi:hypothetical protein [uncultured Chryseobacterium sp.]|uniref:hypothetical protein n=1 Tax=uncultured Chryseobacterium sp. TaxID=259322 RepID=UPI0025DAA7E6|nr:hypothetical protein [uncultured Chryseobacterium sp.]
MKKFNQRFLFVYSIIVSAVLIGAVIILYKQSDSSYKQVKELVAQQIKIVEPDGTIRLLLSNRILFPGTSMTVNGKIISEERPQAGMLFYNDEGAENGGLIFGGHKNNKNKVVDAGGSLSFDRYAGNQEVQLIGVNDSENRFAGLRISDSNPSTKKNPSRIWVGRDKKGVAEIALMDSLGKKRLVFKVAADGQSSINFLDDQEREISQLTPVKK